MRYWITAIYVSCCCVVSLAAESLPYTVVKQQLSQGGFLLARTQPNTEIRLNGQVSSANEQGMFVVGFGRDHPKVAALTLKNNGLAREVTLDIKARKWRIERVDGLPPAKVNPVAPEILKRIKEEASMVKTARAQLSALDYFDDNFIRPAIGRLSGVYGSQRVLNGEPKRPHFGLDIAAPTGTPVIAPAGGVISLTHNDMFYSGGTVILDHGNGLSSTFIHLSRVTVEPGQKVVSGEKIGEIGATGRATGPHLDWRINWFGVRLDPSLFLEAE